MNLDKNTDICVLVEVNEEEEEMMVYSPLEKKNIIVSITKDVLEGVDVDDGVAFEIDLDKNTIAD